MSKMVIKLDTYAHKTLPTLYQQQVHLTKYSRYIDDLKRRETWAETVYRYIEFMVNHINKNFGYTLSWEEQTELFEGILFLRVMPSMRAMWAAGPALERDNAAAYNCGYTPIDSLVAHDEGLYLSMCTVGVGFSVERQFIGMLPELPSALHHTDTVVVVPDSRIGWASSYRQLISMLFSGFIPKWDTSQVRPAGRRLEIFGGRASGPGPLEDLFRHTIRIISAAVERGDRRLSSEDNHSLFTFMASVADAGGVRRAATISLSNPSDERMRDAKSGDWWKTNSHYRMANNSEVWTDMPTPERFLSEWLALIKSKSGERGIINRNALVDQARKYRRIDVDQYAKLYGLNPCAEVILRPRQFCNLTTNIIRPTDTMKTLCRKIRLSTILGTLQSTLTNFRYLGPDWKRNCEEERLLGVSLNGIMDHPYMAGLEYLRTGSYLVDDFKVDGVKVELPETLAILRDCAVMTNKIWASKIGINPSAAITSIKPEGNNSEMVNCSSGLHGRHAPKRYIRTNRQNKVEPMQQFMADKGIYAEDDVMSPSLRVFYFPIEVPEGSITRYDYTAIEHLKVWSLYQEHYCEHKPSITVSVKDKEWVSVGAWVYENFDKISGVAFLPFDGGSYKQAPYIECTEEEFNALAGKTPVQIDWTEFTEQDDFTESKEYACVGGLCAL